jgi:hypothetical protein
MKYKKFLLIPLLLAFYLTFGLNLLMSFNYGVGTDAVMDKYTAGQQIGVGDKVVVSVTRQYLLGLVRLPVYNSSMGDISRIHETFFTLLGGLAIVFVYLEYSGLQIRWKGNSAGQAEFARYDEPIVRSKRPAKRKRGGNENMLKGKDYKGWIMALLKGIGFGLVAYIIGGDGGGSVGLGLLVAYLEMKLK